MNINRVCHTVFCGRLEARFRGQTIVSIACPCSVLVKPCKSRSFQPLTVLTRPPFPFAFCFLPPVNSGGTVGTSCPEVRLLAVLPQPGYSFSDGHSVFKVLSIDELSQVYTFLIACAVCPKGRKSARKKAITTLSEL